MPQSKHIQQTGGSCKIDSTSLSLSLPEECVLFMVALFLTRSAAIGRNAPCIDFEVVHNGLAVLA